MATFVDEFTEAGDTQLNAHTPDTGTSWIWNGTNDDGFTVENVDRLRAYATGGTVGVGYAAINPELGSADHQVWARLKSQPDLSNTIMAVRVVDEDNCAGFRVTGQGAASRELVKVISGTVTAVSQSQSVDEEWLRVTASGTTYQLWQGGTSTEPTDPDEDTNWTSVSGEITISDGDLSTSEATVGMVNRGDDASTTNWLDEYRANAYGAAASGSIMNQLQNSNVGSDLFNGALQ